jgi:aminoglycoside 6-adenylyltransferase
MTNEPAVGQAMIDLVATWAEERSDVRAALLVGSRARTTQPADEWSDYDFVLLLDDPQPYIDDASWLSAFGRPLLTFLEPTAVGDFVERRVLFDTGQDADFALLPATAAELLQHDDVAMVFGRGYRVLADRAGVGARIRTASPAPDRSETAYAQLSNDFWYHAILAAKKLRRGELFIAKQTCDGYLKALTVQLLAWRPAAGTDTWHGGRFVERWADPADLRELGAAYARYDAGDVIRALWATVDLFERLEQEIGRPPAVPHKEVRQYLADILSPGTSSTGR